MNGVIAILILLVYLLSRASSDGETMEPFVRDQWEKANRWLRRGKYTWEEFQLDIETTRDYVGHEEWDHWIKKIRREKNLLNPKSKAA